MTGDRFYIDPSEEPKPQAVPKKAAPKRTGGVRRLFRRVGMLPAVMVGFYGIPVFLTWALPGWEQLFAQYPPEVLGRLALLAIPVVMGARVLFELGKLLHSRRPCVKIAESIYTVLTEFGRLLSYLGTTIKEAMLIFLPETFSEEAKKESDEPGSVKIDLDALNAVDAMVEEDFDAAALRTRTNGEEK